MRKPDHQQPRLFYCFCPESLIPADYSLRPIKRMVEENLEALDAAVAHATCEREAAVGMIEAIPGDNKADKAYDAKNFVEQCRSNNVVAHVARKKNSAIYARTTRRDGYAVSLRKR